MILTLTPSRLPSWESAFEKFPIAALTDAPIEKSAPGERAAAANIDHITLGGLEHWPKQSTHPHTAEKLQGIAVHPSLIRQLGEIARSGGASRANQYVAAIESILHGVEHALTAIERSQIGSNGDWCGTSRCNRLARRGE